MIVFSLLLGLFALALSASFSGSETAYYRAPRIRMKLDAIAKDRTARNLLWFANNPSFFVATVLVGNNIANYLVSMATVLFVGAILPNSQGVGVEILSTLCLAPLLFVYGEMFPKYLCLHAPNRMLRTLSPFITFFFRLLLPITSVLWILNRGMSALLGRSREMIHLTLARGELSRVLDEGRDVGILFEAQQCLANGVFAVSNRLVRDWAIPVAVMPTLTSDMTPREALEIARQNNAVELPVFETENESTPKSLPLGYVRTIDLEFAVRGFYGEASPELLHLLQTKLPIRGLVELSSQHTLLTAMILLQTLHGTIGCVIDESRRCVGFVRSDQLRDVMFSA